jgi:hypothetical protein
MRFDAGAATEEQFAGGGAGKVSGSSMDEIKKRLIDLKTNDSRELDLSSCELKVCCCLRGGYFYRPIDRERMVPREYRK